MILKASARGTPMALAKHLLNERDNDQIETHRVEGFMSSDLSEAMREVQAMSAGLRSQKPLFSVSLSPPEEATADVELFERTADQIMEANGLKGQPHALIFHEKENRRHAHLVVSRIDSERMTVIPLPFFKMKLKEISKAAYLENGWRLPDGYVDRESRDPRNFDLALYQQAKREGRDPKHIKMLAQEAWAVSDNSKTLQQALEQRGLYLARGDRGRFVVSTWRGEIMALPRLLSRKTKEVRERLGEDRELRSLEQTRVHIAKTVGPVLAKLIPQAETERDNALQPLNEQRQELTADQRLERQRMDMGQSARHENEQRARAERFRIGVAGLWDKLTGRKAELRRHNELEAYEALKRDQRQRQAMIEAQLAERRTLQSQILEVRARHEARIDEIYRDLSQQLEAVPDRSSARIEWLKANSPSEQRQDRQSTNRERSSESRRSVSSDRLAWLEAQQRGRSGIPRDNGSQIDPDIGHELD
ncbi:relaxase/mobilization nuclease domain-containing protein [Citromicrobium bathyomarinum]|uniref:relaxase/mobilization nuclease domain-containing protein n=1 Tax=Citromicrobium bathyomarinum TaxID=72174 RepID=UPI001E5773FC|nr:relaxase/mobilization nuclease domain-containing protein [Citromicrobium bathyomarinum]MCD1624035.1 relaxase [Citromicrobium bathyomarinum]